MFKKFIFPILFLLIAFPYFGYSQNIVIHEETVITQIMDKYEEINTAETFIDGWRIQLLATTDRQRMEAERRNFRYRYPSVSVNWVHSSPYYKLRAGAFISKLEALRLKYILSQDYSGIYLVKDDKINKAELLDSL